MNDYEAKFSDLPAESRCPQCRSCGANIGYLPTADEAVISWNRRAHADQPDLLAIAVKALQPFSETKPTNIVRVEDDDTERTILTENQFKLAREAFDHLSAVLNTGLLQGTYDLKVVTVVRAVTESIRLESALAVANANHEKFERLWYLANDDVDRLKLAICGGEDVPGAINIVTVEDCERFIREERARHIEAEAGLDAAGVGFDGGSLTLGALERARADRDDSTAQPEYDFKAEDEWFEHVPSRPDDYEGPDVGMHDTEIVENEDV